MAWLSQLRPSSDFTDFVKRKKRNAPDPLLLKGEFCSAGVSGSFLERMATFSFFSKGGLRPYARCASLTPNFSDPNDEYSKAQFTPVLDRQLD
jgi:hypothetical protein